jgi:hypothetical protein
MAQVASLLQKAQARAPEAPKKDWASFAPPQARDAAQRIVAAGMRLMYSPAMRDELSAAVQSEAPPAQKLAENVVGLMLVLDKQSNGQMPVDAMFPAAMGLLSEASEILGATGQKVTADVFQEAAARMVGLMAQKINPDVTPEQVQQGLADGMGAAGSENDMGSAEGEAEDASDGEEEMA